MKNSELQAFPGVVDNATCKGLTKREYFAAKAMEGILAGRMGPCTHKDTAENAVKFADELLKKLGDGK